MIVHQRHFLNKVDISIQLVLVEVALEAVGFSVRGSDLVLTLCWPYFFKG